MASVRSITSLIFTIVLSFFLTGFACVVDLTFGRMLYAQHQAERLPTTMGTVITSEVTKVVDREGRTNYSAQIVFEYQIEGLTYTSDRYRHIKWSSPSSHAHSITNRYPIGSEVAVHYNPTEPSYAILEAGLNQLELAVTGNFIAMHLVMLLSWSTTVGAIKRRVVNRPAGGACISTSGMKTIVRLPRITPLTTATLVAIGILVIVPTVVSLLPDTEYLIVVLWSSALVLATGIYLWGSHVVRSGTRDLVINDEDSTLILPRTFGRKTLTKVPYSTVRDLSIEARGYFFYRTYAIKLTWNGDLSSHKVDFLAEWRDPKRSEDFMPWLVNHIEGKGN